MTEWKVIPSPSDPEMSAVMGAYLVADNLPIEDARLIAAAPELLELATALVTPEYEKELAPHLMGLRLKAFPVIAKATGSEAA